MLRLSNSEGDHFLNFFRGATTKHQFLGIEAGAQDLCLAACAVNKHDTQTEPSYTVTALKVFDDLAIRADGGKVLRDWVVQHQLKGAPCNVSLAAGQYQLLLTEAPEVPPRELRDALRWKVRDLSSIPLAEAVIDAFSLPMDGSRSGKAMAYVVVSELKQIDNIINMVQQAELRLNAIDISEMAIRNLSLLTPEGQVQDRGLGVVQVFAGRASLNIYRAGNLYLSRQFNLDYAGGLIDDIPVDSFLLEVQRSLDYYERQMGQTPPAILYICGENISADKINSSISRGLSVPAKYLDLENLFSSQEEQIDAGELQLCCIALGTALRERVTAQ